MTEKKLLDNLPWQASALECSAELIARVTQNGFQWPDLQGPLAKVEEELEEFKAELHRKPQNTKKIFHELGDLLFTVCNMAHLLQIDSDAALKATLQRFKARFDYVEAELNKKGKRPLDSDLAEMNNLWIEAKKKQIGES